MWTNIELAPVFSAWLLRNSEGRQEVVVPPAQRLLAEMGKVVQGGFWPTLLEAAGTRDFAEGRFPVFTTKLRPGMEPHRQKFASAEAVQRCKADGKRWPCYWYEDRFLRWKEDEYRLFLPQEVEALMGMPRHYTSVPDPDGSKMSDKLLEDTRISPLAKAWDVGALRLLIFSMAFFAGCPVEAKAFAATNTKAAGFNQVLLKPYETPFRAFCELEGQSFIDGYTISRKKP